MSSSELFTTPSAHTDLEIRERCRALRDARPATPPPASDETPTVRITPAPALPREVVEARAVEAVITDATPAMPSTPPRFPRAGAALLALELAESCRGAATLLNAAAAGAPETDPATLRRQASAIVRALVRELGTRVVLVLAIVCAVACGGEAEPAPVPYEPPAPQTGGDQSPDGAATYHIPALACVAVLGEPGFAVAVREKTDPPATNADLVTIEGSCIHFEARARSDGAQASNWLLTVRGDVTIREGSFGQCSCDPAWVYR